MYLKKIVTSILFKIEVIVNITPPFYSKYEVVSNHILLYKHSLNNFLP